MDSTILEILVKLKDEASAAFKKMGDNIAETSDATTSKLGSLASSIGPVGAAIGVAALAAAGFAVAFGVSAVNEWAKAQAGLASIDATLKTMGVSAIANKQAILDASDAALRFGFDNDDAARSITRFYQATGDLTQATKLNNIAMDLARAKNLDLSTAAALVNQVLGGNGRVLKQYQINLRDSATPLEALGELQEKVAGQAQAFAETFSGQMGVLNVQWDDMKKKIGGLLAEALLPLIQKFNAWLTDPKTQEQFAHLIQKFQDLATVVIPQLVKVFGELLDILSVIFDWLMKIADMIEKVVKTSGSLLKNFGGGSIMTGVTSLMNPISAGTQFIKNLVPFASGGIVTQPTMAMIGEAGPEAVIPLSDVGDVGGGGVSIHIGSLYGTDQAAAIRFANEVARVLGNQLKLRV